MTVRQYTGKNTFSGMNWYIIKKELEDDGDTIAGAFEHDLDTGDGSIDTSLDATAFATAIASAVTTIAGTHPPRAIDEAYQIQKSDGGSVLMFNPTATRAATIPTLTPDDAGWCCYVVNKSASFNVNITGFDSADVAVADCEWSILYWDGDDFCIMQTTGVSKTPV